MSAFKKTVSVVLLAATLALIVLLPKYASSMLNAKSALDWLKPKDEAYTGVMSCWHIVRFKPHSGSMGAWLEKHAKRIEKLHFGVYLEVESITEAEAARRRAAGLFPDIISFPRGMLNKSELSEIPSGALGSAEAERVFARPLAASCELILCYPEMEERDKLIETAKAHSLEEFRAGKARCCVTDARGAGDMQRLLSAGKAEYFEVVPFETKTELVQFIGVSGGIEEAKLPYALEFIERLLSETAQKELVSMGLLPMNKLVPLEYEQGYLASAYRLIAESGGVDASAFETEREKANDG